MLQFSTFTGSIFILETNIYNTYVIQMYNENYVSLHNEYTMYLSTFNYICKVCMNHVKHFSHVRLWSFTR